jgi:hypothetical protein
MATSTVRESRSIKAPFRVSLSLTEPSLAPMYRVAILLTLLLVVLPYLVGLFSVLILFRLSKEESFWVTEQGSRRSHSPATSNGQSQQESPLER